MMGSFLDKPVTQEKVLPTPFPGFQKKKKADPVFRGVWNC